MKVKARFAAIGAAAMLACAGMTQATILLQDDFSGASVDTTKWTTRQSFGGAGGAANNVITGGRLHQFAPPGPDMEIISNASFNGANLTVSFDIEKPASEGGGYYTAIQYGDDSANKVVWALQLTGGNINVKVMDPPGNNFAFFTIKHSISYDPNSPFHIDAVANATGTETTLTRTQGANVTSVTFTHWNPGPQQFFMWSWNNGGSSLVGAYLDNVVITDEGVIPEPASLAILGIAPLLMMRRRATQA